MENSIFLAKLLGPYCVILGIGVLLNMDTYLKVMDDFVKNTAFLYLGGVMALLFGLLVILFHNVWAAHWSVIITIFGWMGLLKGTWLVMFPNQLGSLTKVYQTHTTFIRVQLVLVLVTGGVLSYFGYFA